MVRGPWWERQESKKKAICCTVICEAYDVITLCRMSRRWIFYYNLLKSISPIALHNSCRRPPYLAKSSVPTPSRGAGVGVIWALVGSQTDTLLLVSISSKDIIIAPDYTDGPISPCICCLPSENRYRQTLRRRISSRYRFAFMASTHASCVLNVYLLPTLQPTGLLSALIRSNRTLFSRSSKTSRISPSCSAFFIFSCNLVKPNFQIIFFSVSTDNSQLAQDRPSEVPESVHAPCPPPPP